MPTARAPAQSWRTRPAKPAPPHRGSPTKRGRHCCRPLSPDLDPLGGLLATLPAPSGFGGSRHPRRDATPGLAFGRQERAGSREPWRPASWWPARRSTASRTNAFGIFPRGRLPLSGRLPCGPMPASHRFVPENVRSATPWKRVSGIATDRACARIRWFAFAVPPPRHQPGFPKAPWPVLRHKRLMPWQFPVASSLAYSRDALMTCESYQGGKCCRCPVNSVDIVDRSRLDLRRYRHSSTS